MARPKKNEDPIVTRPLIRTAIDGFEEKIAAYNAEKQNLNDFRNQTIEQTSLLLQPVEWAYKKARARAGVARAEIANKCVSWLRAVVMTWSEMGIFDQADMFLVDELVEEIKTKTSVAA